MKNNEWRIQGHAYICHFDCVANGDRDDVVSQYLRSNGDCVPGYVHLAVDFSFFAFFFALSLHLCVCP